MQKTTSPKYDLFKIQKYRSGNSDWLFFLEEKVTRLLQGDQYEKSDYFETTLWS